MKFVLYSTKARQIRSIHNQNHEVDINTVKIYLFLLSMALPTKNILSKMNSTVHLNAHGAYFHSFQN